VLAKQGSRCCKNIHAQRHGTPSLPTGDIHRYDELCSRHATLLNGQPGLVAHERRLREKITILCLMELISGLPPDRRTVALSTVAERTKLPLDGVEFLLMKVGWLDQHPCGCRAAVQWLLACNARDSCCILLDNR
jgi:hypothetical protein